MLKRDRRDNPETLDSNKWLKKLQQESWELELLVSGFSIILLSKLIGGLGSFTENIVFGLNMDASYSNVIVIFSEILELATIALVINLFVHLIFRGFWVGIVGLGSVAPNTDFSILKYSNFFTNKLKKKIINLDKLVITVDKISSVLFAFAFLVIFLLISVAMFFAALVLLGKILSYLIELEWGIFSSALDASIGVILITFLIAALIYLIDFLTLGFFKKYKIISKIYYPIYVLFSWITLSFLYRTIYYNLISKFTKKRIALVLIPYLLLLFVIPGIQMDHHIYFTQDDTQIFMNNNYYSDLRGDEDYIDKADIPSFNIHENNIPLFIRYNPNYNSRLKKLFPDYTPGKNEGISSGWKISKGEKGGVSITGSHKIKEEKPEIAIKSLSGLYRIYLNDSLLTDQKYYFKFHSNKNEKGIFTLIDISHFERGEHTLEIKIIDFDKDNNQIETEYAIIPFWKE